jgi:hypothetical protein
MLRPSGIPGSATRWRAVGIARTGDGTGVSFATAIEKLLRAV